MKKFKKIMAVLVAAIMIVAMTVPVFAATSKTEITITYEKNGATYSGDPITETVEIPENSTSIYWQLKEKVPAAFVNTGKTFIGWSTSTSADDIVDRILVTESMKPGFSVYAIWDDNPPSDSQDNHDFDETGSITIKNSVIGETYTAYQLFKLYSFKDTNLLNDAHANGSEAYSYYIAKKSPIYNWLKDYPHDAAAEAKAFTIDEDRAFTMEINFGTVASPDNEDVEFVPVKAKDWFVAASVADENRESEFLANSAPAQVFARAALSAIENGLKDTTPTPADDDDDKTLGDVFKENFERYAFISNPAAVSDGGNGGTATTTTTVINNLPLGYYLVDSTLGTLCVLDTTNTDVQVIEKNSFAAQNKQVSENEYSVKTDVYGDRNDANIGDTIYYKSTLNLSKRQSNVIYHDVMNTTYLIPNYESITVSAKKHDTDAAYTLTLNTDYKIYTPAYTPAVGDPVEASFPDGWSDRGTAYGITPAFSADTFAIEFLKDLDEDIDVTITYNAKLDTDALVGDQTEVVEDSENPGTYLRKTIEKGSGNDNISRVTFGDAQYTELDWTRTYTWQFDIFKYGEYTTSTPDGEVAATFQNELGEDLFSTAALADYIKNPTGGADDYWLQVEPLQGAKFSLTEITGTQNVTDPDTGEVTGTEPVYTKIAYLERVNAGSASTAAVYRKWLASDGNTNKVEYIETPASGLVQIIGLDANEYVVKEIEAPTGYDKLHYDVTATISSGVQGNNNASQAATMTLTLNDGTTTETHTSATADRKYQLDIENFTGKEMPMTGGMGTTVLYIVGGMLVILAGAYLFFSRKRTA